MWRCYNSRFAAGCGVFGHDVVRVVLMLDVVLLVTVFLAIVLLFVELFTVLLVGGLLVV